MYRYALTLVALTAVSACAASKAESKPSESAQVATAAPVAVTSPTTAGGFISKEQGHELVAQGAALIDVRNPEEYAQKHIEGAKNIPVGELPARLAEVGPKEKPVVVYCKSGKRSSKAAEILRAEGYTVYNLGSVDNW